jgi:hypothetical protein
VLCRNKRLRKSPPAVVYRYITADRRCWLAEKQGESRERNATKKGRKLRDTTEMIRQCIERDVVPGAKHKRRSRVITGRGGGSHLQVLACPANSRDNGDIPGSVQCIVTYQGALRGL